MSVSAISVGPMRIVKTRAINRGAALALSWLGLGEEEGSTGDLCASRVASLKVLLLNHSIARSTSSSVLMWNNAPFRLSMS